MMTRGEMVAAEARQWIETPFAWQQSVKGVGCDCKGLLWGVARELGFPEAESLYAKVSDYSPTRPVPSALLKEGFAAIFDPVPFDERQPGDVLLMRMGRGAPAGHIGIVSSLDSAIHAQIGPKNWVKETKLRALLLKCPVDSVWRWRDG
jgi:NlpC/P60 family putative phage cell wall peptidase